MTISIICGHPTDFYSTHTQYELVKHFSKTHPIFFTNSLEGEKANTPLLDSNAALFNIANIILNVGIAFNLDYNNQYQSIIFGNTSDLPKIAQQYNLFVQSAYILLEREARKNGWFRQYHDEFDSGEQLKTLRELFEASYDAYSEEFLAGNYILRGMRIIEALEEYARQGNVVAIITSTLCDAAAKFKQNSTVHYIYPMSRELTSPEIFNSLEYFHVCYSFAECMNGYNHLIGATNNETYASNIM